SGSWTLGFGLTSRSLGLLGGNGLVGVSCWAKAAQDNPTTAANANPQRPSRLTAAPAISHSSFPGRFFDRRRPSEPRGARLQGVSRPVVIAGVAVCGQGEATSDSRHFLSV